jgi:hypothetical protein
MFFVFATCIYKPERKLQFVFHLVSTKYKAMVVSGRPILHLLLFCCLSLQAFGSRINIVNNGYRDIVVAISPDVSPNQADDLLNKLKVNFLNVKQHCMTILCIIFSFLKVLILYYFSNITFSINCFIVAYYRGFF